MVGMNANYKEVAGVLRTFEGGKAFAREVLVAKHLLEKY